MAIYRTVQTTFWTDQKVEEEFTPEDKYFYLYLFTNPHNNLCGCYKLGIRQASKQIGYNSETIERLLERFETVHGVIEYSKETKEICLLNWYKYNWTRSSKYLVVLRKEIEEIEDENFKQFIGYLFDQYLAESLENARVKGNEKELERLENIPYAYGMHTTNTSSSTNTNTNKNNKDNKNIELVNKILDYLNKRIGSHFRSSTPKNVQLINARLKENYNEEDFYTVIDKKADQWLGTDMEKYLKPATLFCPSHFDDYLNEIYTPKNKAKGKYDGMKFDFE